MGSAGPLDSSLSLHLLTIPSGSSPWRPLPSILPTSGAQTSGPHKADQQSGPAVHRSPAVGPPLPATSPGGEEEELFGQELWGRPLALLHPPQALTVQGSALGLPPSRLPPLIKAPPGSLRLLGTHSCSCFSTQAHFLCPTSPPLLGSALIARHPQILRATSPLL